MIKEDYMIYQQRKEPEKHEKFESEEKSNIVQSEKKKLYDYYICDNCNKEIIVEKKWEQNAGGVVIIPAMVTKKQAIKLALCNKCISKVLEEFEN